MELFLPRFERRIATGGGKTSGVLGDSNGPVAVGAERRQDRDRRAAAVSRSVTYSVVVSPGADTGPRPNQPPVAVVHRRLRRSDL